MAAPMAHTAMASLVAGAGASTFAARPPMAAPSLTPRRRTLVVHASQNNGKSGNDRFFDVFRFNGPAPERINGRLAMLGFVSALAVEVCRGDSLLSQAGSGGGMAWFVITAAVFTTASLVPLLRGESPEDSSNEIFTADAEIWNGRLAMLGLVALAYTEYINGTPFINI